MRRFAEEQTLRWLEDPIPALEGLSPRQAMQTPEGQAKVLELIKYLEFMDDQRPSDAQEGGWTWPAITLCARLVAVIWW